MTQASRDELWGTDSRRIYWWHLPVRPDRTASLGRDMILNCIAWLVLVVLLLFAFDYVLAATA